MKTAYRYTQGVTLVELLVAIGLLALMAGLLLPVFSGTREAANEARNLQQLRQIGAAMHLYAADNQQRFPPGYFFDANATPRERTWASELLVYLGLNPRFYQVKDNPFVSPTSALVVRDGTASSFTPFTYSVHGGLCPNISSGDSRPRLFAIERPSEVILLADAPQLANTYSAATFSQPSLVTSHNAAATADLDAAIPTGPDTDDNSARGWLRYRNRGKVSCLMVDGHVQSFDKGTVLNRHLIYTR